MAFLFLAVAALLFYAFVRFLEAHAPYYPFRDILMTPRDAGLAFEEVILTTEDGVKLHGWFVPAPETGAGNAPSARWNMLYFHGNAGNMSGRIEKIALFHGWGFNIFIFDYRGYGLSQGRPSEEGLYRDGRAAFDYLVSRPDVGKLPVVFYGASLGAAVAVDTALHRKPAALVIEAAFTNAKDMARIYYPFVPGFLVSLKFDSDRKISGITCPKLLMHSPDDEIVPFAIARKLFAAAAEPKEFLEVEGTHNDNVLQSEEKVKAGLTQFLEKYGISQGAE